MRVTAFAGGVGAGKLLRGLVRVVEPADLTVIGNTADDLRLHGLHVSPDLDSVAYWLGGLADRDRGWGRRGETFRTLEEVRRLGGRAWFGLGDLDLATHMVRTQLLSEGRTLAEATDVLRRALGIGCRLLPMSNESVATVIESVDAEGRSRDIPFQEYWVARGARDEVKGVRFDGAAEARPAPGVLEAIASAEVLLIAPSNPIVSIGPILAVPGIREAVRERRDRVAGISPIVSGAPLRGMADRLMPPCGFEVSAAGAARVHADVLGAWVIDERDARLAPRIRDELGVRVEVADTIMVDDETAAALSRAALRAAGG